MLVATRQILLVSQVSGAWQELYYDKACYNMSIEIIGVMVVISFKLSHQPQVTGLDFEGDNKKERDNFLAVIAVVLQRFHECDNVHYHILTLKVLVTAMEALGHF